MPLFKSKHAQASNERVAVANSSDNSPTHNHPDATYTQAQQQPQQQIYARHQQQSQPQYPRPDRFEKQSPEDRPLYNDPRVTSHPAHVLSRHGSTHLEAADEAQSIGQPSVHVVPPASPQSDLPPPVPGKTSFGQSRSAHADKEHKRSKRNLFGLSGSLTGGLGLRDKDSDREREREEKRASTDAKHPGRASSVNVLNKPRPGYNTETAPESQNPTSVQGPYQPPSQSDYQANQSPSSENVSQDRPQYEPYRPQPAPATLEPGQHTARSPQYLEDVPPRFQGQQDQYRPYQQSPSANASQQSLTVPNPPSNEYSTTSLQEQYEAFRPPSQASLNPPSPTGGQFQQQESRPSTAQTGRYSAQSQNPTGQTGSMPRNEGPPNGGLRQQLSSHRDPRSDQRSDEHNQYTNSQDHRVRMSQQTSDIGRNHTPPPRNADDPNNLDYQQLLGKYQELQSKYSKVKRYYFDQQAQVAQLQNTIANQRLSMSRTSVDDAGYEGRFLRLSQAINNFSFNIRKDWREIPSWLRTVCNQDAHLVGKQEMTAVGRAYISRWLFEHIFEQYFHPAIEANLSVHLKNIERNIRRGPKIMLTEEQREDATTKITTWRLTTIEGLQDVLASRQAQQNRENLAKALSHDLNEELKSILNEPTPPGVGEEVFSIVASALDTAYHMPLESRDITVEYFMPGTPINTTYMKVGDPITALTNPGVEERNITPAQGEQDPDQSETMSAGSGEERDRDVESEIRDASAKAAAQKGTGGQPPTNSNNNQTKSEKSIKSSLLGGLMSKKPAPQQRGMSGDSHSTDQPSSQHQSGQQQSQGELSSGGGHEQVGGRVRFAVFMCVEVRGKLGGSGKETLGAAGGQVGPGGQIPGSGAVGGSGSGGAVNVLFKAPVFEY